MDDEQKQTYIMPDTLAAAFDRAAAAMREFAEALNALEFAKRGKVIGVVDGNAALGQLLKPYRWRM